MTELHGHEKEEREAAAEACGVRLAPLYAVHSVLLVLIVVALVIVAR